MKNNELMINVGRAIHKFGFQIKKHSPEILLVAGVVGTVASAVMACKATIKAKEIVDKSKEDIAIIHDCMANETLKENGEYSDEQGKKDLTIAYTNTAVDLAKVYGPSVILGTLSIASILTSNNILRGRNVALAAAYATVDKSYKEYRGRVREKYGEEADKELTFDIKAKEVEKTVVDEKGKEKKVKETVLDSNSNAHSPYAKVFDELNDNWENDSEYNTMFLRKTERWANDYLKSHGYLFLNDVYKALGFQPTRAGQVVGWIYDPINPVGDNYVSFGIDNLYDNGVRLFVNGNESAVWLDFNVDGDILNNFEL